MNIVKLIALGFISGAILGCAQAEITRPPVSIVPNVQQNAVGIDVYARQRAAGNPVPEFRGQSTVQVRTSGQTDGGSFGELSGVECRVDSGIYKATVTTPANLIVPNYGPNSPALFVRCTTQSKSGSVTVNAVNLTAQQRNASAAGTGLLGAIIIGAVNEANRDNLNDDFGYNPINVPLR